MGDWADRRAIPLQSTDRPASLIVTWKAAWLSNAPALEPTRAPGAPTAAQKRRRQRAKRPQSAEARPISPDLRHLACGYGWRRTR